MTDARVSLANYLVVAASYSAFTVTDGMLRMLVLLHFHNLGYTPTQLAFLFLLYEFFGVVTNLVGGFLGTRWGLEVTLIAGLAGQIGALVMLSLLSDQWSVPTQVGYVMMSQGLSGISKDLTKTSSKSAIKLVAPDGDATLFKWVSAVTGSKNAAKGIGFFAGGALLEAFGFRSSLIGMAIALVPALVGTLVYLPAASAAPRPHFDFERSCRNLGRSTCYRQPACSSLARVTSGLSWPSRVLIRHIRLGI